MQVLKWLVLHGIFCSGSCCIILGKKKSVSRILEERGMGAWCTAYYHQEGNASDYKEAGTDVWLGKWLILWSIMEEKKKRKHHCFGTGLTKESVAGPDPETHGLGLILAQCQIDVEQKRVRHQIQADRERWQTKNSSLLLKTHENSIYNPVALLFPLFPQSWTWIWKKKNSCSNEENKKIKIIKLQKAGSTL